MLLQSLMMLIVHQLIKWAYRQLVFIYDWLFQNVSSFIEEIIVMQQTVGEVLKHPLNLDLE